MPLRIPPLSKAPSAPDSQSAPAPPSSDAELFRNAIGAVRELPAVAEPLPAPKPPVRARQREADDQAVLAELKYGGFEGADYDGTTLLEYLAPGYGPKVLRKLKRGEYTCADELDLHRLTVLQARPLLNQFLNECRNEGMRTVRIVHGKGLRSGEQGPVLKQLTETVLRQRKDVLAFASCRPEAGGSGAVLVLLRK
jgi:DNA-nicking Smr family endonuclease